MFECFFQILEYHIILKPFQSSLETFFFFLQRKKCTLSFQQQRNQVQSDCCCHHSDLLTGGYCIEIIQEDFILQFYTSHNIEGETHV